MKLHCGECNKQLTQDMYLVPYKYRWTYRIWDKKESWVDSEGKTHSLLDPEYFFRKGVFYISPYKPKFSRTYKDIYEVESKKEYREKEYPLQMIHYHRVLGGDKSTVVCAASSTLEGVIPKFERGYGCCNYGGGQDLLCSCGNHLGHMYLDCYEDNTISFIEKSTRKCYK